VANQQGGFGEWKSLPAGRRLIGFAHPAGDGAISLHNELGIVGLQPNGIQMRVRERQSIQNCE
jgi:hypothetical protein